MTFSISSLIISLIFVLLLIMMLYFILRSKKGLKIVRIDFIVVLFFMISLRLLFPVEFPTAITLRSKIVLPMIYNFLYFNFSVGILSFSVLSILRAIWIVGIIIKLSKLFKEHLVLLKIMNALKCQKPKLEHLDPKIIRALKLRQIRVLQSDAIPSIATVGIIRPKILIPNIRELTNVEKEFILAHEIQHIKNKDIFLKYSLEILVSVYWWFPPVYMLRKQLDLIIELRVDSQVTKSLSEGACFSYAESLVSVSKKSLNANNFLAHRSAVNFISHSPSILKKRIEFLLDGLEIRKTNRFILLPLFFVPLFFLGVIFEPYDTMSTKLDDTFNIEEMQNSYIFETEDGRNFLYLDGKNVSEIVDKTQPEFENLPIVKE